MKNVVSVFVVMACLAQVAPAAVVFGLEQVTPASGPITLGEPASFRVTLRSDSGVINNLAGIDFVINAADPGFTGTASAGGRFTAGTNELFAPNGGFALAFPSSFQVFGANAGVGLTLGESPTTVATLTLNTVAAIEGTYTMSLNSLLAVDPLFNSMPIVSASPLAYSIAIPEPASLSLLVCAGAMALRRRRRSTATCGV